MITTMHDGLRSRSMYRLAGAVLAAFAALALTVVPAPTASASSDPLSGLRGVDFAQAAHEIGSDVVDARLVRTTHGDLDGDGDDDAAVVITFREGDRWHWSVQAYRNDDGVAVPAGRTHRFSERWERFDRLLITAGVIEFTVASGHDQPTGWLATHRWDLVGGRMRLLETTGSGSLVALTRGGAQPTLSEYVTSAFIDVAPDAVEASFRFVTVEQESLQLQSDDPTATLRIYSAATGDLVTIVNTSSVSALPAGGWIAVPAVSCSRRLTIRVLMMAPTVMRIVSRV